MEEDSTLDHQEGTSEDSFSDYTCAWLRIIDRGGLFHISDEVHQLFVEIEIAMYPALYKNLTSQGAPAMSKDAIIQSVTTDEDVLFSFALVTLYLSASESALLLNDIVILWMTMRGFSITSKIMEDFKKAVNTNTKGKKALRQQLQMGNA